MNSLKLSDKWRNSLARGSMSFSVRQKKDERSEIRRNVVDKIELPDDSEEHLFLDIQAADEVCINPAVVFPYSNRQRESRITIMREESEQWDTFFDPQYTFGCFIHHIAKTNSSTYYYNGKWPLEYEDIVGMASKYSKRLMTKHVGVDDDTSIVSGIEEDVFLIPSVPNPTLPNMNLMKLMGKLDDIEEEYDDDDDDDGNSLSRHRGSMMRIDILPCSPNSLHADKVEDEIVWRKKLGLLNAIQHLVFNEKQDGTHDSAFEGSRTARIQRQIKDRAEKIKKKAHADRRHHDNRESMVYEEMKDIKIRESVVSFRDIQEKHMDLDTIESQEEKHSNRQSFYLFVFGFLFPPLWIINFALGMKKSDNQTEASKSIDKKWRKYSRNAFVISLLAFTVSLLIVVATKPGSVGFRQNLGEYLQEDVVLFDDENFLLDV
ncbi:hypothetical protein G6F56_005879 [Rhizopus delemar]|uniref:Uncharacterized protein n=1 Tax=Rhizopus stolonifer TaxID=4846 RepID=A0A367IPG1_RHIST|nr:hypothetical protein G6F56_005879 [Rhizopus delemar]RCH79543.1 hypothetical protein CU098_004182 [Rhizopus stolonifer]